MKTKKVKPLCKPMCTECGVLNGNHAMGCEILSGKCLKPIAASERREGLPEHTPLPWQVSGIDSIRVVSYKDASKGIYSDELIAEGVTRQNAEFIVRAVNNFDALLIEIQYLHELAKQLKDYNPEWRAKVERLIANAGGK
jgi:hypothetical protein